jgi:hypothetical protein
MNALASLSDKDSGDRQRLLEYIRHLEGDKVADAVASAGIDELERIVSWLRAGRPAFVAESVDKK